MTIPSVQVRRGIRLVALDIDGVLTDGTISVDEHDSHRRLFDIKDGFGIVQLVASGRAVIVISSSAITAGVARLARLGIDPVHTGVADKTAVLQAEVSSRGLRFDQVAYMGDDVPDVGPLELAGFSLAPADAHPRVRAVAQHTTTARGGRGAVRELADMLLESDESAE